MYKKVIICFSLYLSSTSLSIGQQRYYTELSHHQIDSLKGVYPLVKGTPKIYESSIYTAIQAFPELKNSEITIKEKKLITTMNAQPTVWSLIFKHRSKRNYVIRINKLASDSILQFSSVPHNGQVGVFVHELTHFSDYRGLSFFGVFGRLFSLLGRDSRGSYEKRIDLGVIARGFGWQLYDWSFYVLYESNATAKYKAFKRRHYLTPDRIKEQIVSLEK